MSKIFEGIRVIDLTQGMAGSLITMILADFGAEVIRIEPDGGDPMWEHPAYLLWQRGKKSVCVDWATDAGRKQARDLIASSDVLIESLGPGKAEDLGLEYREFARRNAAFVQLSINAFGETGPYRDYPAHDGIVNAKTGRMRDQVGWQEGRPTFRAVNDTSYHSAMFGLQALIAGLRVAWTSGKGQLVQTSLLNGVSAPNNPWRRLLGVDLPADRYAGQIDRAAIARGELIPDRRESDPATATPTQLCPQTRDGRWIMHAHIQHNLFKSWIRTLGLDWIWEDPRFSSAPKFDNDSDRITLNNMIFDIMRQKTALEWREIYRANPDCAGEIMQTTQEALHHEQFVQNGHLIEIHDPRVGPMQQLGAFAKFSKTPAVIAKPAPIPGGNSSELAALCARVPVPPTAGHALPRRPLKGITMIEMATWLAAPFSGALLADLGARVIKVETLDGDPFRAMPTNENMIRSMQGKESIALNLKTEEGRRIFHRLVAEADIVMHNFRPGAPERIGADYETLRKIRPDLIYVYAASYGSTGPDSKRAAFNPTMGAFSGNSVFQSGEGNIPKGDQSPDPIAGSGVATGIMLGLAARLRTGEGQYIETSMVVSNVYCNSDDAFDYAGKPDRQVPGKDQIGLEATYRLYETSEGWVFLAVRFDDEFRRFCTAVGRDDLADHPDYASWPARFAHRVPLGSLIAEILRTRTAEQWETDLAQQGLGCVRADGPGHRRFLHEDPHAVEIGMMVPTQSPAFADLAPQGGYWRHAPVARFSTTPCQPGMPFGDLGNATGAILSELGYDATEQHRLKAAGIVGGAIEAESAPATPG